MPLSFGRDEIGKGEIGAPRLARHLLPERMQRRDPLASPLIGIKRDIVADAVRRPEADDPVAPSAISRR